MVVTKRVVLSYIARLFDPLGFLTPFTMLAKVLFHDLWRLGLAWDEEVPVDTRKQFTRWVSGFEVLRKWEIPRSYTGHPWRDNVKIELHGFGDASEKEYGACVYLCTQTSDGAHCSTLVTFRAKVAPLKKMTLPRLELLGALLCARLVSFVREALRLPVDVSYTCWTDSMVVLSWVQGQPSRWKDFVSNRLVEIQDIKSPSRWQHCPGVENPADLVTSGVHAPDLVGSQLWLRRTDFLYGDSE